MVRRRGLVYLLLRDHRPRPVTAVRHLRIGHIGTVGHAPIDGRDRSGVDELAWLRLVVEATAVAPREPGSETLPAGGDGEGRGGEEDLAEESGGEHHDGCMQRRRRKGRPERSGL